MRPELWGALFLIALPGAAQRGDIDRVIVSPAPALVGAQVSITVMGTGVCRMVDIDYGDGNSVTHRLGELPATVPYRYTRPGTYTIRARGRGNCTGEVTTSLRAVRGTEQDADSMRFRDMDQNGDGVITRSEWRGNLQSFRTHDWNSDGVLSGEEVGADSDRRAGRREQFAALDANGNGVITRNEWPRAERGFEQLDADGDGVITRREYNAGQAADGSDTSGRAIVVDPARDWTETGLYVQRGDVVQVSASGTVQLSTDGRDTADPGGSLTGRRAPSAPLADRVAGALIARVGNSEPIFVGAAQSFRAPASGEVFLGVNDDHLGDNQGQFRVRISVGR